MDIPEIPELASLAPKARYREGMSGPKATMLVILCAVLILAVLFIAALTIEQWLDNAKIETPSETRSVASAPESQPPAMIGAPGQWITADDYPAEAIRNEEQGTVRIGWTIEPSGRVGRCGVLESSGHASLDRAACAAIEARGRYKDIRPDTYPRRSSRRVVWRLPQ